MALHLRRELRRDGVPMVTAAWIQRCPTSRPASCGACRWFALLPSLDSPHLKSQPVQPCWSKLLTRNASVSISEASLVYGLFSHEYP
eukprot:2694947-Pyramimonas_sp.AAC.1